MSSEEVFRNPRLFVPFWFVQKKLNVISNLILNEQDEAFELDLVFNGMWLDYRQQLHGFNAELRVPLKGFSERDLTKALEEFLEVKRREALVEIRELIKCTGEDFAELRKFLIAATGKCDDISLAVLSHMIWQVKRKMFSRKVNDHIMVVFRGDQGAGKTEAVKILFNVIKAWFKGASLKEITDDRWKFFFKNAFVVFCDELQHAEWASIDALKNIISAEEFESRRLGTNIYSNVRQNCIFVGATNRPVAEIIRDNTGMRRFFEIETLSKMDWTAINNLDIKKMWQGIDESRTEPYTRLFKSEIAALQAELILPDVEEDFLNHFGLKASNNGQQTKFLSNSDLYAVYVQFVSNSGERQKASNKFHQKIKGLGMKLFECRQGRRGERGYQLSTEAIEMLALYRTKNHFNF